MADAAVGQIPADIQAAYLAKDPAAMAKAIRAHPNAKGIPADYSDQRVVSEFLGNNPDIISKKLFSSPPKAESPSAPADWSQAARYTGIPGLIDKVGSAAGAVAPIVKGVASYDSKVAGAVAPAIRSAGSAVMDAGRSAAGAVQGFLHDKPSGKPIPPPFSITEKGRQAVRDATAAIAPYAARVVMT